MTNLKRRADQLLRQADKEKGRRRGALFKQVLRLYENAGEAWFARSVAKGVERFSR